MPEENFHHANILSYGNSYHTPLHINLNSSVITALINRKLFETNHLNCLKFAVIDSHFTALHYIACLQWVGVNMTCACVASPCSRSS